MMENKIFNINEAIILLKEGTILKDKNMSKFILKKERVSVYGNNSYYSLDLKEFAQLYKEVKFVIENNDDSFIDGQKDEEYYGFKHK